MRACAIEMPRWYDTRKMFIKLGTYIVQTANGILVKLRAQRLPQQVEDRTEVELSEIKPKSRGKKKKNNKCNNEEDKEWDEKSLDYTEGYSEIQKTVKESPQIESEDEKLLNQDKNTEDRKQAR